MNCETPVWHHNGSDEKELYHYTGCGLDDVYLKSGYTIERTPYGEGISIRDLDDLHVAIGLFLVKRRKDLDGPEIRFLRHHMDLTQAELAKLFGCSDQQVARYEKGKSSLNGAADRLLRILFEEHVATHGCVRELLELLNRMDSDEGTIVLESESNGWKIAA